MAQIFEVLMLVCFGVSWPFNIAKSLKSRTAKGKSAVYILDILMVSFDLILTLRNKLYDRRAEKKEAKA